MSKSCRIRIVKELDGVYPQYQPKVGIVYNAEYVESKNKRRKVPAVCVVNICGKEIIVRKNEYEIVGALNG